MTSNRENLVDVFKQGTRAFKIVINAPASFITLPVFFSTGILAVMNADAFVKCFEQNKFENDPILGLATSLSHSI